MAYSNFTLETVREAFDLEEVDIAGLFSDSEPMPPSDLLTAVLARNIPLATAIATEKAKSELKGVTKFSASLQAWSTKKHKGSRHTPMCRN